LGKERFGSPSARACQPILGAKLNSLSFKIKFEPTFFIEMLGFADCRPATREFLKKRITEVCGSSPWMS